MAIALIVLLLGLGALAVTAIAFIAAGRPLPEPLPQPTILFDEVPASGGAYSEAGVGRFRWLNPLLAVDGSPDADVAALAFAGLTRRTSSGEVVPDLALDYEISPDGLNYVFRLREDAVWHDGAPVTAEDVIFTFSLLRDPSFPGPDALARYWRDVEVNSPDPTRIRFRLSEPRIGFLEAASLGLLPAHVLKGVAATDLPGNVFNARPVGSGPFRVGAATGERVTLEASGNYHGTRPLLARVVLRLYPDERAALDALARGEVSAVRDLRSPLAADLAERVKTYRAVVGSRPTVLLLNASYPALAEPATRRAIALAIDRARVGDSALPGRSATANNLLAPGLWARGVGSSAEYAPERAREMLDAAGWRAGDDGIRVRDGQQLAFVLLTNDSPEHARAAAEVSRQLAAIGVRAEVQTAGWTGVFQDFLAPRRFQAALVTLDLPAAEPDLYSLLHSSQAKDGLNLAGWSSPESDRLLAQVRAETQPDARRPLWADLDRLLADESPLVPLYRPTLTTGVDRGIRGVEVGTELRPSDRFATISTWYAQTKLVPRGR